MFPEPVLGLALVVPSHSRFAFAPGEQKSVSTPQRPQKERSKHLVDGFDKRLERLSDDSCRAGRQAVDMDFDHRLGDDLLFNLFLLREKNDFRLIDDLLHLGLDEFLLILLLDFFHLRLSGQTKKIRVQQKIMQQTFFFKILASFLG